MKVRLKKDVQLGNSTKPKGMVLELARFKAKELIESEAAEQVFDEMQMVERWYPPKKNKVTKTKKVEN